MSGQHTQGRINAVGSELMLEKGRYRMASRITACGAGGNMQQDVDAAKANARRLAACWNAFDGVPTEKIDGKSVAEYVASEAYITGLVPVATGGMELGLSGNACQLLAESFAGQFKGSGGINFIEVQMRHKEIGPFTVTIQRTYGETPAQQKAEALRKLDAARALLQEVLDGTQPFISALECECDFDGEKWAEKARSFLEGK